MSELWAAAWAFPSALFSAGLALSVVYWLLIILGALDLDFSPGGADGLHALKGVDALHGLKGVDALHGLKGVDGLHALKGADGLSVLKGADGLAAAKGAFGAEPGALIPGGIPDGIPDGATFWVRLRQVPITVIFSGLSLFGWVLSMLGMRHLAPVLSTALPDVISAATVLVLTLAVALPLTSLATRPLRSVFQPKSAKRRVDFVGTTCRIRTGSVDDSFGQAEVEDGGAGLIVEVRATPGTLKRGSTALIIDYDAQHEAYLVEHYAEGEALKLSEPTVPEE